MLFEPVRKTQDAMHFKTIQRPAPPPAEDGDGKEGGGAANGAAAARGTQGPVMETYYVPCGPREPGAVQTTMEDLAAKGLASKVGHSCGCVPLRLHV